MARRVVITGLGPVSGLGIGIDPTWQAMLAGESKVRPLTAFDPANFDCRVGAQVDDDFSVRDFVPKTYRKATKVMARDIELAVAAADLAARDAGLRTKGTDPDADSSYPSIRVGAHIGAGLIAAQLEELTAALVRAREEDGNFTMAKWGSEGMTHLTPLWLLKYLPNMLACHVTIIHDTQGPSNTVTCGEASALLSVGESLRVIQRDAADMCFCGGGDSKINPMGYLRQHYAGLLNARDNDRPQQAVRPFDKDAAGTVCGEGGGIVCLESFDTHQQRSNDGARKAYAEIIGFGASQSVNRETQNLTPDASGRGLRLSIQHALNEAEVSPEQINAVIPFGLGTPSYDSAEAAAYRDVFGTHLKNVNFAPVKSLAGSCAAGVGGLDIAVAAKIVSEQKLPPIINCDNPIEGMESAATRGEKSADIEYALVLNTSVGGQNAAMLLKRV